MAQKTSKELSAQIVTEEAKAKFSSLFSLREFFRIGIASPTFSITDGMSKAIVLTAAGERLVHDSIASRVTLNEAECRFAVFLLFGHHESYVDVLATDEQCLTTELNTKILQGEFSFPWLFEHALYDKAFTLFPQKPSHLTPEETKALLTGTPNGVFQLHHFTVGPFGLLSSVQSRMLSPTRKVLLWHCDDHTCPALHESVLTPQDTRLEEAVTSLKQQLSKSEGPSPSWLSLWVDGLISKQAYYDDLGHDDLPWLLGNAFSETEIRNLLRALLESGKSSMRNRFPSDERFKQTLKGSAAEIASRTQKAEALQLILLTSDEHVVSELEKLIDLREILIPPTEIRNPVYSIGTPRWSDTAYQCSNLGVRSTINSSFLPLARLKRLVLSLYDTDDEKEELDWMLRKARGETLGQKLESFIAGEDPDSMLRNLVFDSRKRLVKSFQQLRSPHLKLPTTDAEEDSLRKRLLWKLGLPVLNSDQTLGTFRANLARFVQTASRKAGDEQDWTNSVRSSGVNVFVGLEGILDAALLFATWVFLTDHISEMHTYNPANARLLTADMLSGVLETDRGPVTYDRRGKNTLFPLIVGFRSLKRKVEALLAEQKKRYVKPSSELARFSHESKLQLFPYHHRFFALDMDDKERSQSLALLDRVTTVLERDGLIVAVRNRIDHISERFPTLSEIEACQKRLAEAVQELEVSGLYPSVFLAKSVTSDGWGRQIVKSGSDTSQEILWSPSPALDVISSLPGLRQPQIIVQYIHVPETNEPLRFRLEEDSEFTKLWKDYPKRQKTTIVPITDESPNEARQA